MRYNILKDPTWTKYPELVSSDLWCEDEFTYFEGWCYSLRDSSDFHEADCRALNATMVSEPDNNINFFVAGKIGTRNYKRYTIFICHLNIPKHIHPVSRFSDIQGLTPNKLWSIGKM